MKVTVIGPNLSGPDQAKGTIHVHASGCADVGKTLKRSGQNGQSGLEVANRLAVAEAWFDFLDDPSEGLSEIWFAPCVTALPGGGGR